MGVDAGGSATRVAVSNDGAPAGDARGDAANVATLGAERAAGVIATAMRAALAGRSPDAVYVGAAGAGRAALADDLAARLRALFPTAVVEVGDDAPIALRAAIPDGDGAVLVAGTGSVAYAVHGGRALRVGGLGHLAGDEGSAFWIGLQAVKLYGRQLDGRAPADETGALAARALDAPDRDRYLAALYDLPLRPAALAALAPSIIAFAGKGNRASTKIVQQAALELGDLIKAAVKTVGLLDASPRIALAGGLFAENSLLTYLVETRLQGDIAGATLLKGGEPVQGALRCAERAVHAPLA